MSTFRPLAEIPPQRIWTDVVARTVQGEHISFAVVELSPGSTVDDHAHPNEQIGIVLQGSLTFTIGAVTRVVHAGDTYNIPGGVRHRAVAGQEGAVVVDVFSPVRSDWSTFPREEPRLPVWP